MLHSIVRLLRFGFSVPRADARVFDGAGMQAGFQYMSQSITGFFQGGLKNIAIRIVNTVLNLVGIVAVIMIVIAGIYLITGQGSDDSRTKAKNIILWTGVGLVVILLSRFLVAFVLQISP